MRTTLRVLNERTGGLSNTSKMPGKSWSIPAQECQTGGKLAKIEGSVCHGCYALKGMYRFPTVKNALSKRMLRATAGLWVDDMVQLVGRERYFRWFDSGDLQGEWMLDRIAEVAKRTPQTKHYLPTKEYGYLRKWLKRNAPPPNLVIRASAPMVNQSIKGVFPLVTSCFTSDENRSGFPCPASSKYEGTCGPCRACWSPNAEEIAYPRH